MLQSNPFFAANTWTAVLLNGWEDAVGGLRWWRVWWLVALSDIRQRYQRSLFGQFWLTLSMGVTIGAIGFVYSVLFHQDMATYLPFLGVGIVCWGLIAAIVTEGCTASGNRPTSCGRAGCRARSSFTACCSATSSYLGTTRHRRAHSDRIRGAGRLGHAAGYSRPPADVADGCMVGLLLGLLCARLGICRRSSPAWFRSRFHHARHLQGGTGQRPFVGGDPSQPVCELLGAPADPLLGAGPGSHALCHGDFRHGEQVRSHTPGLFALSRPHHLLVGRVQGTRWH